MISARAYVYCGEWIAECPRQDCYNAELLCVPANPHQPVGPFNPRSVQKPAFHCSNCKHLGPIDWPDPELAAEIMRVLLMRPVPSTRNWYPADHPTAVTSRVPHGQTPDDLREENEAHGVPVG